MRVSRASSTGTGESRAGVNLRIMARRSTLLEDALHLTALADAAANRSQYMPLVSAVAARVKEVRTAHLEYQRTRPASMRLSQHADDESANYEIGKFLCLVKGEWDKGLPLLARGVESQLRALAGKD